MKLTTEQTQAILDGAPEGATYFCENSQYWKLLDNVKWQVYESHHGNYFWVEEEPLYLEWIKCLSDLREIITLRQEVERLKAQQSEVAARAVEGFASELKERAKLIPLGAESKSKGAATYNWQMFYAEVAENYANQLRKGEGDV